MARHYFNTVENSVTGKPVNGATIEVVDTLDAYVTIYSDDGTTTIDQTNSPLTSDSTGFFEFWTNETSGTVRISYDGEVKRTITDVEFPDGEVASADLTTINSRLDALEAADANVTPLDFGGVGDGVANDTAAIISALATNEAVYLPDGYTFRFISDVTISTNFQRFGGPGLLEPEGNCGVVVSGATGVELDLAFNGPSHTGVLVKVLNSNRTIIHRLNCVDGDDMLYIEQVNDLHCGMIWGSCRGYGIKIKGSDSLRSDVIHFDRAVIDPGAAEYGFDWDGNIHTVTGRVGIVGGLGIILRDTSASANPANKPAIGRVIFESDYSGADGIRIDVGLDIDLTDCYSLGATSSGLYVGALVNDREVRVSGGKYRGNTRYGIENAGGVVLYSGNADLQDNTLGETLGNVWTEVKRVGPDENSYYTISSSNPLLTFDANDYMAYDRAANTLRFFVGSDESGTITSGGINLSPDKLLTLPASTASFAQINFGEGVAVTAPNEGDFWLEGNVFKYRAFGTTSALALQASATNQTGLITGGQVVWETGLTFRVSAAQYYINGQIYESAEQTVTLAAADGTNPRIDVIYVDTAGVANDITGTAAANPSEPDVDPSTQLKLTFVLVGAGVSTPSGVSNENVYLENTEWTGTTSGAGWTLGSTTDPYAGTTHIQAAAVAANGYVSLDHGAAITLTDYDVLQLFIKPTTAFPAGRVLRAQWYNNGVALGIPQTIASGYWGFNASTLSYQLVAIPMANFVLTAGTTGDQLRITVVGGALSFRIDNIKLQVQGSSLPGTGGSGLTQAQADALYVPLPYATAAQYRANTADKPLGTDEVWASADYVTINDSGGNIAVDMSSGFNFAMTMDGNYTLSNPTNTKNGQSGEIVLTQDGTGSRTLAYGSNWKFAGGTDPVLSTTAGAVDVLSYKVVSSTFIIAALNKAFA